MVLLHIRTTQESQAASLVKFVSGLGGDSVTDGRTEDRRTGGVHNIFIDKTWGYLTVSAIWKVFFCTGEANDAVQLEHTVKHM